jgi:quercetin 2,3-dioxygenase
VTRSSGIRTHHSFSFGTHYDPENVRWGPMICHDDHELDAGAGFADHGHAALEIVTWVVAGELVHDGSTSLRPGQVAVQSAGSGVTHSEVAGDQGCRFVQAWLRPDAAGGTPAREVAAVDVGPGQLTPLVGPQAPLAVGVAGAALDVVRLVAGQGLALPAAALVHAFVVTGRVGSTYGRLVAGDAVRCRGAPPLELATETAAEVLVWRLAAEG